LGLYFCGILDPATVQDCTKFPRLITIVLLQLVRDIIEYVTSVMKTCWATERSSNWVQTL